MIQEEIQPQSPFPSHYFSYEDISYTFTYTNSIVLILPFLPNTHPPQHDITRTSAGVSYMIVLVSYKVNKWIRDFFYFYDTLSAERMPT